MKQVQFSCEDNVVIISSSLLSVDSVQVNNSVEHIMAPSYNDSQKEVVSC